MAKQQDPTKRLLERLPDDAALVRRSGFVRLYDRARPISVADLAAQSGIAETRVEAALAALTGSGAAIVGAGGALVATGGLSVVPTQHRLRLTDREFFTWCGFDAVGIPAALDVDGLVHSPCGFCAALVQVVVIAGQLPVDESVMGWLPGGPCQDMQADFCAAASLFCNPQHLIAWRATAGDPPGRSATLSELAHEGRRVWAEMRPAATADEVGQRYGVVPPTAAASSSAGSPAEPHGQGCAIRTRRRSRSD